MKKKINFRLNWGVIIDTCMMIYDALAVCAAYFLALVIRFEGNIHYVSKPYWEAMKVTVPITALIAVVIFFFCRMYHKVWRFVGFDELISTFFGSTIVSLIHSALVTLYIYLKYGNRGYNRMPFTYYIFGYCLQLFAVVAIRILARFFYSRKSNADSNFSNYERVMLVGGGEAGVIIIRALRREKSVNEKICCIIDDDPKKLGRYIEGIKVVGGRDDILSSAKKYKIDKIYVAIPSASEAELREILQICNETDCVTKKLSSAYLSMSNEITTHSLKDISLEDLLGRDPIEPDMKEVFNYIKGKTIMVTGGGGSIGSELCRQIAKHAPARLIIFDVYENNAYDIQNELLAKYPTLELTTLIGSVRDSRRLNDVFSQYKPDIVYHAAAHKHVPLMEVSPCEAIKNNVIGTYKTAYAAMMNGCSRFVLISTDKAVNPTNVMGASKRICEMVIQAFDSKIRQGKADEIARLFTHASDGEEALPLPENIKTEFVAVRFGNVLGSNGSVIPLFKKQIENGGPITVTHPDIIRYFMTIPEAVSLVLTAGTYAGGGEIYVLDMGSPMKIDTLARNLIKLSGLKPDVDIKIEYTGLREGEKLYEEKLMAEEGLRKTENKLIHIGCPIPFDTDVFSSQLVRLMDAAYSNDTGIRELIAETVSTYKPISTEEKA